MENIEKETSGELTNNNSVLKAYMHDVNRYKLLTEAEEKSLTQAYFTSKEPKLREKLVRHNLRLVVKIAYEYRAAHGNLMDLIQEGSIGLMRGVEKFEPERGVPLAHYSATWIRAFMLRFIINNSRLVKIGTTEAQRKLFFNLSKEKAKLEAQGIEITDATLAQHLKVEEKELVEMSKRLSSPDTSIDMDLENANPKILALEADGLQPDDALEQAELRDRLQERLREFRCGLSIKNALVFDRRLMQDEPDTFEVIGVELGVTRQRVQQIEADIKNKLSTFLRYHD